MDSFINVLRCKIHNATVTGSDLNYEGSIAIDPGLIDHATFFKFERVDIYNVTTGARFSTYVIEGQPGELSLNGAAARLVQKGDRLIITAYTWLSQEKAASHNPRVVILGDNNAVKSIVSK